MDPNDQVLRCCYEGVLELKRVQKIIELLEQNRTDEAIFFSKISQPSNSSCLTKANYNPFEPRDKAGLWTKFGADTGKESNLVEQIQYRGFFHDFVVKDFMNSMITHGAIAIANVPVIGINGILAIPDGAALTPASKIPVFIEVKTGFNPKLTINQSQVYPLICLGYHAMSFDPRIADLGLVPGQLLPPMDVMIVRTLGPLMPLHLVSFCESTGLWSVPNAH